jgi:hypothetical protein
VNRVNEIALALQLPAGHQIRTSLDRGTIVFEVPKTPEERYPVLAADLWVACPPEAGRLIVPIGADIAGRAVQLDFSSPDSPHLLVAGTTGSGKSVALETILRGLIRYPVESLRLRLVDPKGTELLDFEDDPHTDGLIGGDAVDALEILEAAVAEMQGRYELGRVRGSYQRPRRQGADRGAAATADSEGPGSRNTRHCCYAEAQRGRHLHDHPLEPPSATRPPSEDGYRQSHHLG